MVKTTGMEIEIAFPELDAEAILRVFFSRVDSPDERLRFRSLADNRVELAECGRFVVQLRPHCRWFPFAVVLCVDNCNVITGDDSTTLRRDPQNYFASPPQGGIDGYFLDGRLLPFHAGRGAQAAPSSLAIRVFPIKRDAVEYWNYGWRLSGNPHYAITGLTLEHGGQRQCEPLYEDLCSLGDWDTARCVEFVVGMGCTD